MTETFQNNEIAIGYDNTANLVNIETISINSIPMSKVDDLGKWSQGDYLRDGDSVLQPQGYAMTSWAAGYMTLDQWNYWFNYLGHKRSGKVTIRTRRYEASYSVICNAVLDIGNPPTLTKGVNAYLPFVYRFTRVRVIEEERMYGAIYAVDASTAQADITTTPVLLTGFAGNSPYSGTTPAFGSSNITALYAGDYRVDFHISATATASQQFIFHVRVNAVEGNYACEFTTNATPDSVTASFTGYLTLAANDIVTVYVETDDADAGTSLTPIDMQLSIERVAIG